MRIKSLKSKIVKIVKGRQILVVDDNKSAADSLAKLLEYFGHTLSVAYDGRDALSEIDIHTTNVVLLDIGLPVLDGYEVARELRRKYDEAGRKLLLIAISGYGQEADKQRSLEAGFDYHLVKPVDVVILEKLLK